MTEGRAFGKVILLGEHAVVYGVPALAVGIERGAFARSRAIDAEASVLHLEGFDVELREDDHEKDLSRAFRAIVAATRETAEIPRAVRVDARADLPPGGGLGCSAALGVAIARALDPTADNGEVRRRAGAWEQVFHGKPSGIDAAVSAEGGCLQFEKTEHGAKISPIALAPAGLVLAVGHSGMASSTKSMVEAVARLRERRPEVVQKTFDGIRSLTANARLALEGGDTFALGRLMDLNQMLLSGLFLSTPEIERMCTVARGAGAQGAKLTGAGGGGSVVALVPSEAQGAAVVEAWRAEGFGGFVTRAHGTVRLRGLSVESSP